MSESLVLTSLPLFPLNTVLFPGGTLQLQIFEVRYLDLIGKCFKTGAPFGVVSLQQGSEVRKPVATALSADGFAPEVFSDVGTLATITEFSTPQAGLMLVRCTAGQRFRITRRRQMRHGLWVADVVGVPADMHTEVPEDLRPVAHALGHVIQRLQESEPAHTRQPLQEPLQLDDSGWVANRWCELLALPPDMKQSLMQLENPLLRLELIGDFLNKGGFSD